MKRFESFPSLSLTLLCGVCWRRLGQRRGVARDKLEICHSGCPARWLGSTLNFCPSSLPIGYKSAVTRPHPYMPLPAESGRFAAPVATAYVDEAAKALRCARGLRRTTRPQLRPLVHEIHGMFFALFCLGVTAQVCVVTICIVAFTGRLTSMVFSRVFSCAQRVRCSGLHTLFGDWVQRQPAAHCSAAWGLCEACRRPEGRLQLGFLPAHASR